MGAIKSLRLKKRLGSLNTKHAIRLSQTLNHLEGIIEGTYQKAMKEQEKQQQLPYENQIKELQAFWDRVSLFMQQNSSTPFTYVLYQYDYSRKILQKKKMGYNIQLLKLLGSNIQQFYSNILKKGETGFEALKDIKDYFKF
eukprot:TRINITY_DN4069_c0_g1_i1.p2 TRINITY_DN4069_c0_g1~~TRINITY_DN4069_c0_g1_i1.p2  ORF type:complete len:141 (-),score=19.81 TRINITY_DN4069_c0_g1_i1:371-793(-)